ncbi:1-acyl-sn-glycerol-3-phosphate acyltransferase [Gordonia sp. 'Campus']|uniref:lysophospholipid acyltransferase family protein n=1 Tax=Gordonia sp. 'Campus' TaxID=2915824 RepID=UPI001EE4B6DD|nr:lysophospholipid acyltransferase family protein [Gordonia sp. 'Campus']
MRRRTSLAYALCRYVLIGPALVVWARPRIVGREHLPTRGPVIVAANHLSVLDSFYLALAARRPVTFLAKREYFERPGPVGRLQRWFFLALGQIPVDRRGGTEASSALRRAVEILNDGGAWGIHPEGTRSPDGRMYRGRTGAVRVALITGAPLVPVAISGTGRADGRSPGRHRVTIDILPALDLGSGGATEDRIRVLTDELMATICGRSGQSYIDEYARQWTRADRPGAA